MARVQMPPVPPRFPAKIVAPDSRPVLASGVRVTRGTGEKFRRLSQAWQQQAFGYYNTVGECWYASQFYSRALAKLRLFAGEINEQGEIVELEPAHPASELLARVQDPGGGRSQLQGNYGKLMFLNGEGFLTVSVENDMEAWEFLSVSELRLNSTGGYVRFRAPGVAPEDLAGAGDDMFEPADGETVVYRMWRRHPEYSWLADAPIRGVLELFEELQLLQLAVRARAKSRAVQAGIVYVPNELDLNGADGVNDEDPAQDPFMDLLIRTMTTAIQNPGSAAAVAPIVVRGPAEFAESLRKIDLYDMTESYPETGLRSEIIKRIATGLDMPPELLLGMTDANHWTAWQIDDQTWSAHLQPVAQQMCDDFTSAYLRPAAREEGIDSWASLVVGYDAADVINHPDRAKDAMSVYDRGGLSRATLREVTGFGDDDAPSEEEHQEWLAVQFRDPLSLPETDGGGSPAGPADNASDVEEAPPAVERQQMVEESTVTASSQVWLEIVSAAEMAWMRCRELAGSRARSKVQKGEAARLIDGVSNDMVVSTLAASGATVDTSCAGGAASFRQFCTRRGMDRRTADRLAGLLEDHAAATMANSEIGMLPDRFVAFAQKAASSCASRP